MFDFFKDLYYELNGIDSNAVAEERKNKLIEKRKNRFIFSTKAKIIVVVFGILYLVIMGLNVAGLKETGGLSVGFVLRTLLLVAVDISCLVCLLIGKKKMEIAALILIIVFVITQYLTIIFL